MDLKRFKNIEKEEEKKEENKKTKKQKKGKMLFGPSLHKGLVPCLPC